MANLLNSESDSQAEVIDKRKQYNQDKGKRYSNKRYFNKDKNEKKEYQKYDPEQFKEEALNLLHKNGRVVINLFGGMDQNTEKDDIYDFYKNIKINAVRIYQTKQGYLTADMHIEREKSFLKILDVGCGKLRQ